MMNSRFCYVILHYIIADETINCINHILSINEDSAIIVVDNASPNDSGFHIKEHYKNNENVVVIINDKNMGYASGNNVGVKAALELFAPDFVVVLNNDIQIDQSDFETKISEFYLKNRFDVLGPDIYSITLLIHQNPKRRRGYKYDEVVKLINVYEKKNENKSILRMQSVFRKSIFLKRIVNRVRVSIKRENYTKTQWGVMLHGACLVFSKDYFADKERCFYEETFMYYEAEILQYELERDQKASVYYPELRVEHHQNTSTDLAFNKSYEQLKFKNQNMYRSLVAFKNYMESDLRNNCKG